MSARGSMGAACVRSVRSAEDVVTSANHVSEHKPPSWWNMAGNRMEFAGETKERLLFHAVNAEFAIVRTNHPEVFIYEWKMKHGKHDQVSGSVEVTEGIVLSSFDLAKMPHTPVSTKTAVQFDADFFAQGRAIRKGIWLNVPTAGTGLAGDPNISMLVTPDMQTLVMDFMLRRTE